jgi:hypothetical protein
VELREILTASPSALRLIDLDPPDASLREAV